MAEAGEGPVWAAGMMTGTSMDGLDVALLRTDGERIEAFGPGFFAPAWPGLARDLGARLRDVADLCPDVLRERGRWPVWLAGLEARVTAFHSWALAGARADEDGAEGSAGLWRRMAAEGGVVGAHGQTVLHRPDAGLTLQLLDAAAFDTGGIAHVTDFRSADVAAGGEGAPLVPVYHHALARRIGARGPVAFLNIGGVANVTWVDPSKERPEETGALVAFDTGPGNALVDDWMRARTGAAMDAGGAAAAAGRVRRERLGSNAARAFLDRQPPKSLDRNAFAAVRAAMEGLGVEDGAATLTAFTADCVAEAIRHMPVPPERWLVCGGGRRNATLMGWLGARIGEATGAAVEPVEAAGLDGDMLEAQAFAYLAVRRLRGLPTSAPSTTGCARAVSGGRITRP